MPKMKPQIGYVIKYEDGIMNFNGIMFIYKNHSKGLTKVLITEYPKKRKK